jgi:hypothetical protein
LFQYQFLTATIVVLESVDGKTPTDGIGDDEAEEEEGGTKCSVPLLDLFPILDEENLARCEVASRAIDHCRFFYKNLWRPWDIDDESEDWLGEHLSDRFELYGEFQQLGPLSHSWTRMEDLAWQYGDLQEELRLLRRDSRETGEDAEDVATPFEIEARLEEIRKKVLVIEDRTLRLQMNLRAQDKRREGRPPGRACLVVVPGGPLQAIREYLEKVEVAVEDFATSNARIFQDAEEAIQAAIRDDVVVLPGGGGVERRFVVEDLGELSYGGAVVGIGEEPATLVSKVKYDAADLGQKLLVQNANVFH